MLFSSSELLTSQESDLGFIKKTQVVKQAQLAAKALSPSNKRCSSSSNS